LTRPEEPEEGMEVAEKKATFLDVLKGLEASTKYLYQSVTKNSITVMCNS
jgi:hypothetical protein